MATSIASQGSPQDMQHRIHQPVAYKVDGAKTITLSAKCIYYYQIDKVLAVSR